MGLLEKAGNLKTEEAKPIKRKKRQQKKREPEPVVAEVPKKARRKKREKQLDLDELVGEDTQFGPPGNFILASPGARRARGLVDFIVNWTIPFSILFIEAMGTFWDPTLLWIGAFALIFFNIGFLPYRFKRTIGNFVSRTRYVNNKENHPIFLYVTIKMMTIPLLMGAMILIATYAGELENKEAITPFAFGILFAIIPLIDWIVLKIRHEAGQGLWDTAFKAYMVAHVPEDGAEGWLAKLESTGDYFESKGWLGKEDEDGPGPSE